MTGINSSPSKLRVHCLVALIASVGGQACAPSEIPYRAPRRVAFEPAKNVVIFLVDTLRADHLGCYGYGRDTSPRIDAFAAQGILFEHCIAQSTWTKPASASVLTGLYPSEHGMTSESAILPLSVKNIAGLLKGTALKTAAFAGNQYVFRAQGEMLRDFDQRQGFGSKQAPNYARAEVIIDAALEWIEERAEEPFLVYIHTVDPHAPYGGTPPFDEKFITPGASELQGDFVLKNSTRVLDQLDSDDRQHLIDLYDGDVAYTDHQFGRFLDRMSALGRDADTMILFIADHGEEFNEHGDWMHNPLMHPEVLNIPLILRMPLASRASSKGRRTDLCGQVDVLPSVLDALGKWPRAGLSGRSLFDDPGSDLGSGLFSEVEGEASKKILINRDYKYLRQWSPGFSERLYDLREDPDERDNLASKPSAVLSQMRAELESFISKSTSGYSILFQNPGHKTLVVDCYLTSGLPFDRVKLFYADTKKRHGELRDGPPEFSQDDDQYKVHVRLHVLPVDGDGISFTSNAGAGNTRLEIQVDGQPAKASLVRMGPEKTIPKAFPLILPATAAAELAASQPLPKDKSLKDSYRILLWTNMGKATELAPISAEERGELEALGYAGSDPEDG